MQALAQGMIAVANRLADKDDATMPTKGTMKYLPQRAIERKLFLVRGCDQHTLFLYALG